MHETQWMSQFWDVEEILLVSDKSIKMNFSSHSLVIIRPASFLLIFSTFIHASCMAEIMKIQQKSFTYSMLRNKGLIIWCFSTVGP